jgi:hypothetical protein
MADAREMPGIEHPWFGDNTDLRLRAGALRGVVR